VRPAGYFPRFQTPVHQIRQNLVCRLKTGRWPPSASRNRQGHWLRALLRNVTAFLGLTFKDRLLDGFDRLIQMGRIPVSRSV
jgi:hypothetical protein